MKTTFQGLSSHIWLMATILDNPDGACDCHLRKFLAESVPTLLSGRGRPFILYVIDFCESLHFFIINKHTRKIEARVISKVTFYFLSRW